MQSPLEAIRRVAAQEVLDRTTSLSAAPPVALQILSIVRKPGSTAESLIKFIQVDPDLTAQLLRVVNTVRFSGAGAASLSEAVFRLGTAEVGRIAMSLTVGRLLTMRKTAYVPDPPELWRHAVRTALASRLLANSCTPDQGDPDVIFTAGLLHDIGKIVINSSANALLEDIARRVHEEHAASAEAERTVVGADHAEIGGLMLEQWKLPAVVANAAHYHHEPEHDPTGLAHVIHVGNWCAHALPSSEKWEALIATLRPEALDHLGLSREKIESSWGGIVAEMETIERFISR